jgi:hypothetical protein
MDYSLPAWLGALAGTLLAVAVYVPAIRIVEQRMRHRQGPLALGKRTEFEDRLSFMRRIILGLTVAVLSTVGYWIGDVIGGKWAG